MKKEGEFKFSMDIRLNGKNFALGCDFSDAYNNKTLTKELVDDGFKTLEKEFYLKLQALGAIE